MRFLSGSGHVAGAAEKPKLSMGWQPKQEGAQEVSLLGPRAYGLIFTRQRVWMKDTAIWGV